MITDTKTTALRHDPARTELWRMVKELGSQKAAADKLEINAAYLGEMLNGKNAISENVLKKIGFVRLTVNVREDGAQLVMRAIEQALEETARLPSPFPQPRQKKRSAVPEAPMAA